MKKIFLVACLLWMNAAHAQVEKPVSQVKPLTLEAAWLLAEQNSVSLKAAHAAVIAAEGQAEDTRGFLWNNPEVTADGARRQSPQPDLTTPTYREWGAGISQTIEIAGQHGYRREAARQAFAAARFFALEAEREVRAEVEKRFVQVLALQTRIANEREALTLIESTATFAGKRVAAGEDNKLDSNVALIEAGRARNQVAALADQLLQAHGELAAILQWPAASLPEVAGELESRTVVLPQEQLLALAAERAQLKALQAKEGAARNKLDLERAARIPDITLGLGVSREGPEEFRDKITTFSVTIPLPLFKRNAGNVAQARADLTNAQAERQAGERDAQASVRVLWQRQQNLTARVQTLRDTVLSALEENQRLSQKALREGEISLAQQVLINRQLLDGRRDLVDAATELRLTRIALDRATGAQTESKSR